MITFARNMLMRKYTGTYTFTYTQELILATNYRA